MDRLKFLKFFVYITEVTRDNGPHCYVRGSHQRKPPALLTDGRKSDEEIADHYGDRSVEICGPRGTIFAADTRGFHKGKLLHRGIRLVYEMEFSNLTFGQTYPPVSIHSDRDAKVAEIKRLYPATYSNFHIRST